MYLPMWEALLTDPLSDIFREEMLYQAKENYPKLEEDKTELTILEIATGTGSGTVQLIRDLIAQYENIKITINCYDEVVNQLNRAHERVKAYDKRMKNAYRKKGLSFVYNFQVKNYKDPINLETDSVDIIFSFQNLHFIGLGNRYGYFENLARMITPEGVIFMAQTTSYNDLFPYPLTVAYLPVEGFQGYPTVETMKELVSTFFKKTHSSGLDAIWSMSQPKFN